MSLEFNNTDNYQGIVQVYEKEIGADYGFISGNTTRLKGLAADATLAWESYLAIALSASGTWQFDDSNHDDYPIIKTNVVQGQRDYTFTTDGDGNLILDVYKALILPSASAATYQEIYPFDQQTKDHATSITSEDTTQGVPHQYDKTANGIIFDVPPSYNATNGLKLLINREASAFSYTDTTKKPGCPGLHHRYFALKPALGYARRNSLSVESSLRNEVLSLEREIEDYFSRRSRDEKPRIIPKAIRYV